MADTSQFERKMLTANRIMGGIGKAGFFMGLGVAGGIGLAVKQAGDFEEEMNVLKVVSGANADEFERMRKRAIALGEDLTLPATSAKDAADTMMALSRGGLNVRQSMDAAKGTIQLATAAQIDNASAGIIQARALKSFNLQGGQAAHVADLFANAANASTADITDLALGVQQASAVFHSSGQNLDTLTVAITEMADAGVSGSDAGTSLRTMMNRLNPQTKKAAAEMKNLGINVFDAQGNYKPLRNIIGQFHESLDKLNPKQKQHALYTIFGSDAIRAANIVLDGGTKKFDKYSEKVGKSGTAAKVARAHQKGFNGAMDNFLSQLQTAAINIGTLFLPAATSMMRILARGAAFMGDHATTTKTLAIALGILATAMVTLTGIYKVYMGVTKLVEFYQTLFKNSVFLTRIQLMALAIWTRIVTTAQWLWNAALAANPIGLVIIAIAALIAGFILLYKHSGTFREIVNGVWDTLKGWASWVKDVFVKVVPKAFEKVKDWLRAHWKDAVILLVTGPFGLLIKKADDAFGLRQKLSAGLSTVLGKIRTWGGNVLDFFRGLPGRIADFGTRIGTRLKDSVVAAVKGLATTLSGIIRGALRTVINIWNALEIPGFSWGVHKGPIDFSISVPDIPLPNIPVSLATGGIVREPTLAMVGDNPGRNEAIIPLPERKDLLNGGGGVNVYVNVEGSVLSDRDLEEKLLDVLSTYGRRNGRVRLSVATSS